MSEDILERAAAIAESLRSLESAARKQELERACRGDAALTRHVRVLLAGGDEPAQSLLNRVIAKLQGSLDVSEAARTLSGTLGGYILKRPLGSGSGGAVYLAERAQVGGEVALKVLLHPEQEEQFLREQRIHANLKHPGIPRFHHGAPQADMAYFALEYVAGSAITVHCREQRATLRERLRLMREACHAVAYAQVHYLHRDLKPHNILVQREERGAFSVRVLDFGAAIARESADLSLAPGDQLDGTAPGGFSYGYAAPEQYTLGPLSPATDVFALGVLLYELLATTHPYGEVGDPERSEEIVRLTLETVPEPVSRAAQRARAEEVLGAVSASTWRDLDRLVQKAMQRDPAERYHDVAALLADLENFEQSRPLEARPNGLAYRMRKFVGRHPIFVSVSLVLTMVVAAFSFQLSRAYVEVQRHSESARHASRFMMTVLAGGQWSAAPRRDLTLVEVLDRVVAAAEQLTAEPLLKAELLGHAGNLYTVTGQYAKARALLREALKLRTAGLGARALEVGWDHYGLAELERERGDAARAFEHAKQARQIAARSARPDPALRALSALELARLLNGRGRHEEAIAELTLAQRELTRAGGSAELEDGLRYELANAHRLLGRLNQASALHVQSLQLAQARQDTASIAESLLSLADLEEAQGSAGHAEERARAAAELLERFYGVRSPATLGALVLQARLLNSLTRYEQAAQVAQRALSEQRALFADQPTEQTAQALHALCTAHHALDHAHEALAFCEEAHDLELALHHKDGPHRHVVAALRRLGEAFAQTHDLTDAERRLREALEMAQALRPAAPVEVGEVRATLGRLLRRTSRCAEAVRESEASHELLVLSEPPPRSIRREALEDLVACHDLLGNDVQAARFRAELAR